MLQDVCFWGLMLGSWPNMTFMSCSHASSSKASRILTNELFVYNLRFASVDRPVFLIFSIPASCSRCCYRPTYFTAATTIATTTTATTTTNSDVALVKVVALARTRTSTNTSTSRSWSWSRSWSRVAATTTITTTATTTTTTTTTTTSTTTTHCYCVLLPWLMLFVNSKPSGLGITPPSSHTLSCCRSAVHHHSEL